MATHGFSPLDLENAIRLCRERPDLIFRDPGQSPYEFTKQSLEASRNNSAPGYPTETAIDSDPSSRKSSNAPILGEKKEDQEDDENPPNGGLTAWLQVLAGHLMYMNTWGYITSYGKDGPKGGRSATFQNASTDAPPGIFQTYEISHLGITQMEVSWVGALQIFLLFFIGTFSGRAFDAGLFHLIYPIGVILQCAGVFATSCSQRYWHFLLAQGLCTGLGAGLQFTPCMSLISSYFSSKKTIAISLASCGSGTGAILFPLLVQELLKKIGFGWTLRVLGFVQLGFGVLSIALFRPRKVPQKERLPIVEWKAFRELSYSLYCGGVFFNFWALYFITDYLAEFGQDFLHLHSRVGFIVVMLSNAIGLVGRVFPALLADWKTGPVNTVIPFIFLCGILSLVWIAVDSKASLYGFSAVLGMAMSGVYALLTAGLASLTTDPARTGVRMGMAFSIGSFAALSGPVIGGQLITANGGRFWPAQVWAGASLLVAGGLVTAARFVGTGPVLRVKV